MQFSIEIESELTRYIEIYQQIRARKHWHVNNHITRNGLWGDFPNIRSLNDHGEGKERVPGIWKQYYREVCHRLHIRGCGGAPLRKCRGY